MMAHLVKCQRLGNETIVKRVAKSVDELGCRKVVIKTDGESALVAVQEAVAANRVYETLVENPLACDHQANGSAERAVTEVKAQLHAITISLEAMIRTQVKCEWPLFE